MSKLFSDVTFDPPRFRAEMRRIGARKTYRIFFTPRSGSSWLTDVVTRTRRLGKPEEWFNPNFVPRVAQSLNADNLTNYVKMLKRKQAAGGLFGFEITYYQMLTTFGSEAAFLAHFPPDVPSFFLMREDIVLQAVSLAKSVATSIYHSVDAAVEDIGRADRDFQYDAGTIEYWLAHILDQECRFERFFAASGIAPLRISYEMMMFLGRQDLLRRLATRLGEELGRLDPQEDGHTKIGTEKNQHFAARFARENARLMQAVARRRAGTLGALADQAVGAA